MRKRNPKWILEKEYLRRTRYAVDRLQREPGPFRRDELFDPPLGHSRPHPTITRAGERSWHGRVLRRLRDMGLVEMTGYGNSARYRKAVGASLAGLEDDAALSALLFPIDGAPNATDVNVDLDGGEKKMDASALLGPLMGLLEEVVQRQRGMERHILELRREVSALRTALNSGPQRKEETLLPTEAVG